MLNNNQIDDRRAQAIHPKRDCDTPEQALYWLSKGRNAARRVRISDEEAGLVVVRRDVLDATIWLAMVMKDDSLSHERNDAVDELVDVVDRAGLLGDAQ